VEENTADVSEEQVERATNLLDVRKIIGSLLGVYGVILLLAGIFGSDADKDKAAGGNVNLWVGLALLIACAVFWGWALNRPLSQELSERDGG
jgi:drug/metabolite transporter (DMT)-like permease